VISGTTVGLGEYSPKNPAVRLAAVFFLPLAVAVVGQFLGRVASAYMDREKRRVEKEYLSRTLTLCDLQRMDTDQNGKVDQAEFLSYMLVAIQRVSKEDVEQIARLFRKLDRTKEGVLTKNDLAAFQLDEKFRSSIIHIVS
jgi:EF-hand domain pair/Ion channel